MLHHCWLGRVAKNFSGSLRINLKLLLGELKNLNATLCEYEKEIESLATSARYEKPIQALTCYKGTKNLFALTMI